jgi:lysyl-tRNA synthetase class 1
MHWADVLAEDLLDRGSDHTLATGITPSGPIHVGNLREVLTTEAVHRAVQDAGASARLLYVGDTYDPLREVSPFLEDHPEVDYAEHVGKPISAVPAPDGEHESFAHQFLTPFLDALEALGIEPEVRLAHEMYEGGDYRDAIAAALEHRDAIREVLNDVAGRELGPDWVPFNPRCPECGRFHETEILDREGTTLTVTCACSFEGSLGALEPGAGKLPWRVDWPARWSLLGVTFEAFGKDHAASGGSWDTAVPIAEQVYGIDPPNHTVYEWIHVEEGAMSSSKGTGVAAEDVLEVTPPEVLRFFMMRYQPGKQITFGLDDAILDLVDEYDEAMEQLAEGVESREIPDHERVLELSQPSGDLPEHPGQTVPMRHLTRLVNIYEDPSEVLASVRRSGHVQELTDAEEELLVSRLDRTRAWVDEFASEDDVFGLARDEPPVELVSALDEFRKPAVRLLDPEPGQLRSRAHELTAWLDSAPNVTGREAGPPEELAVLALWWAFDEGEGLDVASALEPRDVKDELQGLFDGTEPERLQREGSEHVLVPLVLHLVRAGRRPGVERDPERLVDRVEAQIEDAGAGRPSALPARSQLVALVDALQGTLEAVQPPADRSPRALASLAGELADELSERLDGLQASLPALHLSDVLLARLLLERARSGLATYRELAAGADWEADRLQNCVYETAEKTGLPTGEAFGLVYLAVLDRERGPRLGPFLAGLERSWVLDRLAALTGS